MDEEFLKLLVDLHKNNERQGPGSSAITKKALSLIDIDPNKQLNIADIGCGTGGQTITLAKNTNSTITAVDLFGDFLAVLEEKAKAKNLDSQITTLEKSMDKLPFKKESLDIIWSEGAIYNIGFENGINKWKSYLKTGGYIAVSEISWITDSRPRQISDHWKNHYPEISTVSKKIRILEKNGFEPTAHFVLPPSAWINEYYQPVQKEIKSFLARHDNSELAQKIVRDEREEFALYKRYQSYFSYGFYIAKKI